VDRRTFALTFTALLPLLAVAYAPQPAKADSSDDTVYLIDAASKLTDMVFGFDDLRTAANALIDLRAAHGVQDGDMVALMDPVGRITNAARAAIELVPTEKYLLAFTFLQKAAFYAMTATNLFVSQMKSDSTALGESIQADAIRFKAAKDEYIDIVKRLNQSPTPRPAARPTRRPPRPTATASAKPAVQPTQGPGTQPTARPDDPTKVPASQQQPNPTSPPPQPTSPPPAPPTEAAPPPKSESTVAPSP